MDIILNETQISKLRDNSKTYSYLSSVFTKSYFKIDNNEMIFFLRGAGGAFQTTLEVEYDGPAYYFSVDYNKWSNALQKFESFDTIKLSLNKNLIKFSVDGSSDVIHLGITKYNENSAEADAINTFIPQQRIGFVDNDRCVEITDEIMDDLSLAGSLFVAQGKVNSIGLGREGVIYADRAVILRTKFTSSLPDALFKNLPEDESYIYVHSYILGLLPFLLRTNNHIRFSDDYEIIYWQDDDSELVITSEYRELAIPSEQELVEFVPQDKDSFFTVDIETLRNALGFFTGFYEGSAWKPLTFTSVANKEIDLRYKHPTADVTKTLNVSCPYDGSFILESEAVRKIVSKIKNKNDQEGPMDVTFNFDDEAPGVDCKFGDYCDVIFANLDDSEE